jgi:putative transposase
VRRGKKYQPEKVLNLLRQIQVAVANGKTTALACKEAGIAEQTYFRWRREYGGLQVDQAKRLKELEQENSKLKRMVANLSSQSKCSIEIRYKITRIFRKPRHPSRPASRCSAPAPKSLWAC